MNILTKTYMKYLIFFMFISIGQASEQYVIPKDILKARDNILESLSKFRLTCLRRYKELSSNNSRTVIEDREMLALYSIILEKDLSKTENQLLEIYQKSKELKIMDN